METIQGILTDIRYSENGFLIGRLNNGLSVKGPMTAPQIGLDYTFHGRMTESPRWGKTFVFESYVRFYPKSLEGIRAYLEENANWIGPKISEQIVTAYQEKSLEILKNHPEKVAAEIQGISQPRAEEISAMLKGMEKFEAVEIALNDIFQGLPISTRVRHKIIDLWKSDAPDKIRKDPYLLITAVKGVGFLTADRIARRVGFALDGHPRIRAGVHHILEEAAWGSGHTYLPKEELVKQAVHLLGLATEKILPALAQMEENDTLIVKGSATYLPSLYNDEVSVADHLREMAGVQ